MAQAAAVDHPPPSAGAGAGATPQSADARTRCVRPPAVRPRDARHFPLDPATLYLNHGTVGVAPLRGDARARAILDEIERHPASFMLRELRSPGAPVAAEPSRLREAAARSAAFSASTATAWPSSTTRAAASTPCCVRSRCDPGDEILLPTSRTAAWPAPQRTSRASAVRWSLRWAMPFPLRDPARGPCARSKAAITPRTRLALLDHVTLADRARACRSAEMAAVVSRARRLRCWSTARTRRARRRSTSPRSASIGTRPTCTSGRSRRAAAASSGRRPNGARGCTRRAVVGRDRRRLAAGIRLARAPATFALACRAGRARLHARRARRRGDARAQPPPCLARAAALARRWGREWVTPESMVGCMVDGAVAGRLGPPTRPAQRLRDALLARARDRGRR